MKEKTGRVKPVGWFSLQCYDDISGNARRWWCSENSFVYKRVSASKEGVVLFPPPIDILGKTNIF